MNFFLDQMKAREKYSWIEDHKLAIKFPTDLPNYIIYDHILSKLPVKSLLRFRSVSKSWLYLIDHDNRFIRMHLQQHSSKIIKPMIVASTVQGSHVTVNEKAGSVKCLTNEENKLLLGSKELKLFQIPFFRRSIPGKIHSSYHGLIVVEDGVDKAKPLRVVNLATRQFRDLPLHHKHYPGFLIKACNVIQDNCTKEYKILLIHEIQGATEFEIFTLNRDSSSWRKLESSSVPKGILFIEKTQPIVNGVIHWITQPLWRPQDRSILAFDINKEQFQKLIYPLEGGLHGQTHLVEIGGNLSVLHFDVAFRLGMDVEMWMLRNYGDRSWVKLYSVSHRFICRELRELKHSFPITTVGDEILLWAVGSSEDVHCLVYYNHKLKTFRSFASQAKVDQAINDAFPFEESLVRVK